VASEEPRPCLHIGLPKTATTWLQTFLFPDHDQIFYLGSYSGPRFPRRSGLDHCRNEEIRQVIRPLVYEGIEDAGLASSRRAFAAHVRPAIERGLVPLYSLESLSIDAPVRRRLRAENLRAVFGKARIVVVLRRPVDLIESSYFQILRRENFRGLYGRLWPIHSPLRYFGVDEWITEERDREIPPHLEYAEVLDLYADLFGRENLHVFLYEELSADPERYLRRLCDVIGIDADQGVRLALGRRVNERWTVPQIERLRRITASVSLSRLFARSNAILRLRILGMNRGHPFTRAPRATVEIAPHWRRWIEDRTREGNRRLARDWHLPVVEHSYPT